MNMFN